MKNYSHLRKHEIFTFQHYLLDTLTHFLQGPAMLRHAGAHVGLALREQGLDTWQGTSHNGLGFQANSLNNQHCDLKLLCDSKYPLDTIQP